MAAKFDGVDGGGGDSFLEIDTTGVSDDVYSWCWWFYITGQGEVSFANYLHLGSNDNTHFWWAKSAVGTRRLALFRTFEFNTSKLEYPDNTLDTDKWTCVAGHITYGSDSQVATLYRRFSDTEDTLQSVSNGPNPTAPNGDPEALGNTIILGNRHDRNRTVQGWMSHVQLWKGVTLSQEELTEAHWFPGTVRQSSLLGYWPLHANGIDYSPARRSFDQGEGTIEEWTRGPPIPATKNRGHFFFWQPAAGGLVTLAGTLGADVELASPLGVGRGLTSTLGIDLEAASPVSVGRGLTGTLGADVELASPLGVGRGLTSTLGADVEAASPLSVGRGLTATLGTDIELASPLGALRGLTATLAADVELASPLSIAGAVALAGTLGADVELASPLVVLRGLTSTLAADVELASPLTISGQVTLAGTLGADVELASPLSVVRGLTATLAADVELASPLTISGQVTLAGTLGTDVELASPLGVGRGITSTLGADVELASSLAVTRGLTTTLAPDIDLASPLTVTAAPFVAFAGMIVADVELASPLNRVRTITATLGIGLDLASPLKITGLFKADVRPLWTAPTKPRAWVVPERAAQKWSV